MCFRNREAAPKCAYTLVLIWSLWSLLATQAQTNTWHAWPGQRLEELLTVNQLWHWRCLPKLPSAGTCCVQRKSHKINITNIKHLAAEDWEQRLGKMDHFYVSRRISSPAASCFNDWTDDCQPHCPQMVRLARPGLVSGGVWRPHGQSVWTPLRLNSIGLIDVFATPEKQQIMMWWWKRDDLEMCSSDSERYLHTLSEWLNNQLCDTNMMLVSEEKRNDEDNLHRN